MTSVARLAGPSAHTESSHTRSGRRRPRLASRDSIPAVHGIALDAGRPSTELVFGTDDIDRAHAHLTAANVRTLSEPPDFVDSLPSAWVADPDGNPLQTVMRGSPGRADASYNP